MNAYEIIENILHDGISQCETSIWERLKLPEFSEVDPRDGFCNFNNAEEFLDYEYKNIINGNSFLETEYYALKPLMEEHEYENVSNQYKKTTQGYFNYKSKWPKVSGKVSELNKCRNEIYCLFEGDFLTIDDFNELHLSTMTMNKLEEVYRKEYLYEGNPTALAKDEMPYRCYCLTWERVKHNKNDILRHIIGSINNECKSCLYYMGWGASKWISDIDFIMLKREEIKKLHDNYIELYHAYLEKQEEKCHAFDLKQKIHIQNAKEREVELEKLKLGYVNADRSSIISLCKNILEASAFAFDFEKSMEIDFNPENGILIVEYQLPTMEDIPKVKEVKYLKSRQEFRNVEVPQRDLAKLFDDACYSITLRSIYVLLKNDTSNFIKAVNFNGWVRTVNKATGITAQTCILSIQAERDEFMKINLESVDPKLCFKHFKGVGSSKLSGITAIQPILEIKRTDKRFVASQNIEVDNSVNLAIMNWEDFEHLIRELFEEEFKSNGGEVKVTQASRDGGVDAVAFDPDPIRGGKIVIQAKRYSNTVGVSAVRDLYGTVLNEGANKGILVTTSDYGSDSYEFAKGKPLTLLNGSHLLYLLEKHGTHARIDLKEAKEVLRTNN